MQRSIMVAIALLIGITGCASHSQNENSNRRTPTSSEVNKSETPTSSTPGKTGTPTLLAGIWHVGRIDGHGVVEGSLVTLDLSQSGSLSGSTGCNRYTGVLHVSDGSFLTDNLVTTRRACAPAIAKQETQFLNALNATVAFDVDASTGLLLKDDRQQIRLKLIKAASPDGAHPLPQDRSLRQVIVFDCERLGVVGVRFLGADTIELSMPESTSVLPRRVTASGAQYADDNLMFWNKGDEAMLQIGQQDYQCQRTSQK